MIPSESVIFLLPINVRGILILAKAFAFFPNFGNFPPTISVDTLKLKVIKNTSLSTVFLNKPFFTEFFYFLNDIFSISVLIGN